MGNTKQVEICKTFVATAAKRMAIYRKYICKQDLIPFFNNRRLKAEPDCSKRKSNFKKFVALYFSTKVIKSNRNDAVDADGMPHDNAGRTTKLLEGTDGYKAFIKFSETSYGSSIISEMVNHPKKYKGFKISESPGKETRAAHRGGIIIAWRFPFQKTFIHSGQKVDPLAILYHEFSHTIVFSEKPLGDHHYLDHERETVMKFENPVRILNGYEPRYSYVHYKGTDTINILTGDKEKGILAVNKYNPAELVARTHKDALK